MKPQFLFPYWCRYLGWGLVIAHVPISMIGRANGMFNILDNSQPPGLFSGEHLFFICTALLMALGLFIVAFSREKIEDEQIWHVRLDSLRWAIYVNYLVLIASLVFIPALLAAVPRPATADRATAARHRPTLSRGRVDCEHHD